MVQINVPPVPAFQVPNTSGTVTNVANVPPSKPVREEGEESGGASSGGSAGAEARDQQHRDNAQTQRRDLERRTGEDRRKQQLPVLLDTRVGERRRTQRRVEDPPPPAVDFKV